MHTKNDLISIPPHTHTNKYIQAIHADSHTHTKKPFSSQDTKKNGGRESKLVGRKDADAKKI